MIIFYIEMLAKKHNFALQFFFMIENWKNQWKPVWVFLHIMKKKTDGRKSNVAQGGWDEFENEWNEVDAVKAISPVRPSLRFTTRFYDFRPGESHASIRKPNQP